MREEELEDIFRQEFGNLDEKKVFLIMVPSDQFVRANLVLIKYLNNMIQKKGVIVNINETSSTFQKCLEKIGVEKIEAVFVDLISKRMSEQCDTINGVFVERPDSLAEISSAITQQLEKKKYDYLFIDSISTFLMYNELNNVKQFLHYLVNKVRIMDVSGIFLATNDTQFKDLTASIAQASDRTVDLTKL